MLTDRIEALSELIQRAEQASDGMGKSNHTKKLLADMSVALVAQATRIQELEQQLADKPRIVLP